MMITALRVSGVRNLVDVAIAPVAGVNLFVGPNGAGKTSLLESIHLLAVGRSFRAGRRLAWLARGAASAEIFARTESHRLGMRQTASDWVGRLDGESVPSRAALTEHLPLFVFHPDSHALIGGEPEHRRRLLDIGVFHVEHRYLGQWRAYRRALGQRNAGLRQGARDGELVVWERTMAETGEAMTRARQDYVNALSPMLSKIQQDIGARLDALELRLNPGWDAEQGFAEALAQSRASDRDSGFTRIGPQRADLRVRDAHGLVAGRLSRGQEKIAALCLLLAQAALFAAGTGRTPVFAMDDVASELDADHEAIVGRWLMASGWQVWATGLERPQWPDTAQSLQMFHVEQGRVQPVL